MAEMTGDASVVALDRLWSGDIADHGGNLLDVVRAGATSMAWWAPHEFDPLSTANRTRLFAGSA